MVLVVVPDEKTWLIVHDACVVPLIVQDSVNVIRAWLNEVLVVYAKVVLPSVTVNFWSSLVSYLKTDEIKADLRTGPLESHVIVDAKIPSVHWSS